MWRSDPLDGGGDAGISVSSVQRIWRSHGLQPHRVRQFKLSKDPAFAAKLKDIVGLYVDPHQAALETGRLPINHRPPAAINRFVAETNHDRKPFVWTAGPNNIIAAVKRGRQVLDSIH